MVRPDVITAAKLNPINMAGNAKYLPRDLYVLDCEGYHMNEREWQLQDIIREVKAYPFETMPGYVFMQVVEKHGIQYNSLTKRELRRIQNAI